MRLNFCLKATEKSLRLIFLLFVLLMFYYHAQAQKQQPNIIFILADDIGYETLNVNGGTSFSTPNLDLMAQEAMNFTQCHGSPLCSPSRFMIVTGKYNFRNYTKWGSLDTGQKTIANLFHDAGYKTACFGKWQLDGGDESIHKFGFDSYCVTNPYLGVSNEKYKNPHIYTNGAFVDNSLTDGKYGDDIFTDSVINFIQRNQASPFFIYYPMALAHPPYQPTPDDAAFATWQSDTLSDPTYYPSMIKYMDKKIGQIINKIKNLGLDNNTIIIYSGDNGTPKDISQSTSGDGLISGGKGLTTSAGTHVPLIVNWPGVTEAGSVDTNLIEFTDFLPTLAHMANLSVPANYGAIDGVDFTEQLKGVNTTPRSWLFFHYDPHPNADTLKRWAQTDEYKLYDTSGSNTSRLFYNIKTDVNEEHPISDQLLSPGELIIKQELLQVINYYIHQGFAIFGPSNLLSFDDVSANLGSLIEINGGSTVKESGAIWNTYSSPVLSSSPHTQDGKEIGHFKSKITGLSANKTYYVRSYATNVAGTAYSSEIKFTTLLHSPVALNATAIRNTNFIARWRSVTDATAYELDVSTSPTFSSQTPDKITVGFSTGITPPTGWTFNKNIGVNTAFFGNLSPSVQFKASGSQIVSEKLNGFATQLKFWIKGINTDNNSSLLVEGLSGETWKTIKQIKNLPLNGFTEMFAFSPYDNSQNNFTQFRFTYTKSKGTLCFDDVVINYNKIIPLFVNGYNDLKVSDTTSMVKGLTADSNYYYRVRAITNTNTSNNSNTIKVTTCSSKNCNQIIAGINNIEATSNKNQLKLIVFPNPSAHTFLLTAASKSKEPVKIFVTDAYGKKVYETITKNPINISFGENFSCGVYFVYAIQDEDRQVIKLIKEK